MAGGGAATRSTNEEEIRPRIALDTKEA